MSKQAWGRAKKVLEALGLTAVQITKFFVRFPQDDEESVQAGLEEWIGKSDPTWKDVFKVMETAEIAIQQRDGLKEELLSSISELLYILDKCKALRG